MAFTNIGLTDNTSHWTLCYAHTSNFLSKDHMTCNSSGPATLAISVGLQQ